MTRTVRPSPPTLDGHTDLDMRVSTATGKDLAAEIVHSVEWSQTFVQTTLPDRLILTQKQFISLQDDMTTMYDTEDRMYVTPLNVMEVKIDRDIDTVAELDEYMDTVEDLKKEIHDHEPNPNGPEGES